MSTSPQNDPVVVEAASAFLTEMKSISTSLVYAAFLTDDGFDVARLPSRVTDGPRFASIASSMQALSEAVTHELRIGDSEYLIIAAKTGYVVQLRVPERPVVLSALFDLDATVGAALALARTYAGRLAPLLSA